MSKIYLAGPMRGYPQFNYPAFHYAAEVLRCNGFEVFSPAERDIEAHGCDISLDNDAGDEAKAAAEHGFSIREAMSADLRYVCEEADSVVVLPGWQKSKGALAEVAAARAIGIPVHAFYENLLGTITLEEVK